MKTDWRNLLIVGLAGALLVSLWEHVDNYLPAASLLAVSGFPQSSEPASVDVFESGGVENDWILDRPPPRFYEASVRAEDIAAGTRTGSMVASFDLMGCVTHWEFWYERELYQECYARSDCSYLTMQVHYHWIAHLGRTAVTAVDGRAGTDMTAGQSLQIMQGDFEAAYSASERDAFEQRWKARYPELAEYLEDAEQPISE